jgi:hypothetical protein
LKLTQDKQCVKKNPALAFRGNLDHNTCSTGRKLRWAIFCLKLISRRIAALAALYSSFFCSGDAASLRQALQVHHLFSLQLFFQTYFEKGTFFMVIYGPD